MVVDLPPDLAPGDGGRARRIEQVLDNLLTNAARHSPEASPIRVSAAPDGAHVAVSVADDGEGVAPERLVHLFRRHAGIGGGEGGGSGLGLVICRGLVEAHGGRIRAESPGPGRGTTITFTLPAAEAEDRAAAVPAPASRDGRGGTSILVVGDDPHARRQMRDALAAADYAPATAAGPGEVARLVEARRPALAVLDLVPSRRRRHRADAHPAGARRRAGDIRLGLRPGRDHRAGAGGGGGRLHRQAVLAGRAGGAGRGGAQAPMPRPRPSCSATSPSTAGRAG